MAMTDEQPRETKRYTPAYSDEDHEDGEDVEKAIVAFSYENSAIKENETKFHTSQVRDLQKLDGPKFLPYALGLLLVCENHTMETSPPFE